MTVFLYSYLYWERISLGIILIFIPLYSLTVVFFLSSIKLLIPLISAHIPFKSEECVKFSLKKLSDFRNPQRYLKLFAYCEMGDLIVLHW